jgi:hypothetical protein
LTSAGENHHSLGFTPTGLLDSAVWFGGIFDLGLEALRSTVSLGGTAVISRIGFMDQQSSGSSGGGTPGFLADAWPVFL